MLLTFPSHDMPPQVGELLPVFTQWVNPNETFKIGYNGKTRTAALNTDAFTRIRENIQNGQAQTPSYNVLAQPHQQFQMLCPEKFLSVVLLLVRYLNRNKI